VALLDLEDDSTVQLDLFGAALNVEKTRQEFAGGVIGDSFHPSQRALDSNSAPF